MTHSGFAYRYELDEPVYFELCRLSFKGDDYKYPVVIKIAVLMCDNLNVGIEAFVAWLREENVQPPPQILMLLRRRRAARGKGRHTGARRGMRAGKPLAWCGWRAFVFLRLRSRRTHRTASLLVAEALGDVISTPRVVSLLTG